MAISKTKEDGAIKIEIWLYPWQIKALKKIAKKMSQPLDWQFLFAINEYIASSLFNFTKDKIKRCPIYLILPRIK